MTPTAGRARVLRAWSSPDDWGVPSIMTRTALDLLALLDNGADPAALARHARHVAADCDRVHCPADWRDDQLPSGSGAAGWRS